MAQTPNKYETKLIDLLYAYCSDDLLEIEYRFDPTRRWRFDVAVPAKKIAFEVEGGTWSGGRHVNPIGFEKDCEKYNKACALGWKVFRLTPKLITEEYIDGLIATLVSSSSPN